MAIVQEVKTVKPHVGNCQNCLNHTTELARWDVLTHPAELPKASHAYPFSHLIPGSIPASTRNSVFTVEYRLTAVAVPDNTKHDIKDPVDPTKMYQFKNFVLNYPLNVKRSILRGPDRNSMRVFPPTELVAQVTIPSTVFPESSFPFEMVVEGISALSKNHDANRHTRWRMRKLNWRIDEEAKIKTFRCPAHQHIPLSKHSSPSPNKSRSQSHTSRAAGSSAARTSPQSLSRRTSDASLPDAELKPAPEVFYIEDTKTVGAGELKEGWKTDFAGKGKIEFLQEFNSQLSDTSCDVDDPIFGLKVTHTLFVEMVVSEDAVTGRTKQVVPTGAARVLRMQFKVPMTERSGLGIAWDDEVPPTYADVPLSPPEYKNVAKLPAIENVMLENDAEYESRQHGGIHANLALA